MGWEACFLCIQYHPVYRTFIGLPCYQTRIKALFKTRCNITHFYKNLFYKNIQADVRFNLKTRLSHELQQLICKCNPVIHSAIISSFQSKRTNQVAMYHYPSCAAFGLPVPSFNHCSYLHYRSVILETKNPLQSLTVVS